MDPKNDETWFDFGETLMELGFEDKALDALNTCISLEPKNALAFYDRGKILLHKVNTEGAMESFKQAFALDPKLKSEFKLDYPRLASSRKFKPLIS